MRTHRAKRSEGFQLIELLIVSTFVGLLAGWGLPWFIKMTTSIEMRSAAFEVVGALRLTRMTAVRQGVKVAIKFREHTSGGVTFTMYQDGDGDGVLSRDIESGVDPQVGLPRNLHHLGRRVRIGLPPGRLPRDPGNPRRRLKRDAIRFNRSDLASFGPLGGSTPGSIYLTDGRSQVLAVRLFGRTGKVKIMTYNARTEKWR